MRVSSGGRGIKRPAPALVPGGNGGDGCQGNSAGNGSAPFAGNGVRAATRPGPAPGGAGGAGGNGSAASAGGTGGAGGAASATADGGNGRHYLQEGVRDAGFAAPMDHKNVARDKIRMVP
jgi:hypothetical protein